MVNYKEFIVNIDNLQGYEILYRKLKTKDLKPNDTLDK